MSENYRQTFDEKGYVRVPAVIPADEIASWREFVLSEFRNPADTVINDTAILYPRVRALLEVPALRDCLREVFGGPFVVVPHTSIARHGFGVFHTDTTGAEINGETFHRHPNYRMVTIAVYLQDNKGGGGITLVPGSHREPDPYVKLTVEKAAMRKRVNGSIWRRFVRRWSLGRLFDWDAPMRTHPRAQAIESRAGDCVMWNLRMIHRATPLTDPAALPPGGKIAIFFTAAANDSEVVGAYMDYVNGQPGNAHLKELRARPATRIPAPSDSISYI